MKELEQIILADAYHHNSPKAWAWILLWVVCAGIVLWFFKQKPRT